MKYIHSRTYKAKCNINKPKQKSLTIPLIVQKELSIGIDDWFQVSYDPEKELIVYERVVKTIYE